MLFRFSDINPKGGPLHWAELFAPMFSMGQRDANKQLLAGRWEAGGQTPTCEDDWGGGREGGGLRSWLGVVVQAARTVWGRRPGGWASSTSTTRT